jgi:hypothetical protein
MTTARIALTALLAFTSACATVPEKPDNSKATRGADSAQEVRDHGLPGVPQNPFFGKLAPAPVGGAFRMEGYIIWGGSVIEEGGRFYMFATRWPEAVTWRNWITHAQIVLASADQPEGPFTFEQVVLEPRGADYWDGLTTLNPLILRHGEQYVLFYTGATYDFPTPSEPLSREDYGRAWNNKRVGVAVSDSIFGPWERQDAPLIEPRPGKWDGAISTNPAVVIHEDGSALLLYKSAPVPYPARNQNRGLFYGAARADHFLGPYTRLNNGEQIVFRGAEAERVEDGFIWYADGYYQMISKSFSERLTGEKEAGFFAYSHDGVDWAVPETAKAYSRTVVFEDGSSREQHKLERPQVLFQDGKPTHVYFGTADPGWETIFNLVIPIRPD